MEQMRGNHHGRQRFMYLKDNVRQMLIEKQAHGLYIQSNYMHFFHHHRSASLLELCRNQSSSIPVLDVQFGKQAGITRTMKRCNNQKCMRCDGISMENTIMCYKSILLEFLFDCGVLFGFMFL